MSKEVGAGGRFDIFLDSARDDHGHNRQTVYFCLFDQSKS